MVKEKQEPILSYFFSQHLIFFIDPLPRDEKEFETRFLGALEILSNIRVSTDERLIRGNFSKAMHALLDTSMEIWREYLLMRGAYRHFCKKRETLELWEKLRSLACEAAQIHSQM